MISCISAFRIPSALARADVSTFHVFFVMFFVIWASRETGCANEIAVFKCACREVSREIASGKAHALSLDCGLRVLSWSKPEIQLRISNQ